MHIIYYCKNNWIVTIWYNIINYNNTDNNWNYMENIFFAKQAGLRFDNDGSLNRGGDN